MSHQEKQRIFDEYARSENYQKWEDLILFNNNTLLGRKSIISHIYAACDLVQEEQQKKIAERACIEPKGMMTRVDKSSIINPENKIQ